MGQVDVLPQHWFAAEPVRRAIRATPYRIQLRAGWRLQLALAPVIARGLSELIARERYDVVFGAYSFHSLAHLRLPPSTVLAFTSDATPTTYRESKVGAAFGSYLGLSRHLDPWILRQEIRVFRSADLLFWPSDWLNDAARRRYGLDPERSRTVPWGANIQAPATLPEPPAIGRDLPLRLLVIGRDWVAKGGPVAFEVMQALRARGVDARLTVIGTTPPDAHRTEHVTVHSYLKKSNPEELAIFEAALHDAHFLLQPSVESYGFAFCEASAYGLPSLCRKVGGIPVTDGVNGHALPPGAGVEDFAAQIVHYLDDPAAYRELSLRSRREYETRLNWDAWARTVTDALRRKVAERAGAAPSAERPASSRT